MTSLCPNVSSSLKKLSISVNIHVVKQLWSLFGQFQKLSTESVGSRRELVANVHTAEGDATKQFRRVGVGGVYWALWATPNELEEAPRSFLSLPPHEDPLRLILLPMNMCLHRTWS